VYFIIIYILNKVTLNIQWCGLRGLACKKPRLCWTDDQSGGVLLL